jgi:cation diffusion facilitator family transporter
LQLLNADAENNMKSNQAHHHESTAHHIHGALDSALSTSQRGIRAVKWSFLILLGTALLQVILVWVTDSVALLADTIHNFSDASTAFPLWFAFALSLRKPTRRFTYGYGRAEDLAGLVVVCAILLSIFFTAYESVTRLIDPKPVEHLWILVAGSLIGFLGNEAVAQYRLRVGKEIGSAALVADGYHARQDGFTSLAVLLGAIGTWLGYPKSDPIAGLLIVIFLLRMVWGTSKEVLIRLLDGVDPQAIQQIKDASQHVNGVREVSEVRVRWLGHRMHGEVNIAVDPDLTVDKVHDVATEVRHRLLHELRFLSDAIIHVDPEHKSGEDHHRFPEHEHDDLPSHSH